MGLVSSLYAQDKQDLKLWYNQPAGSWVEALPLGNGRLGAMVYGDPLTETIQLNENTVWAGQPNRNDNPEAKAYLSQVRELIFEGKYNEAQDIVNARFISKTSQGMPYQTVGNLKLNFPAHDNYSGYYRELNIGDATTLTRFSVGDVSYSTKVFASYPDQIIVARIEANEPGSINFSATMDRPSGAQVSTISGNTLLLSGCTSDFEGVPGKVQFQARVKIVTEGGTITATDTSLNISEADQATMYISVASNFNNYKDISANAGERSATYLKNALKKTYNQLLDDHITDYQNYFNRVVLDLGVTDSIDNPTDKRIEDFASGNDPQLVALYFQYGRYLLISSSRPGGQPANLQGIWNDQLTPPWDSKYTVNINTEMNYWPSEITNLSEMNEPLIQMIRELAEAGRQTAMDMYGARGWVVHHNTDIWRMTGPIDGSFWGMWPMGGAWLSQHVYERYRYHGDKDYLMSVYPILKEATRFYLDFLIEEPGHQWLVVAPSISPENAPAVHPESSLAAGTTMDNQLVFDLLTITREAAEILAVDDQLVNEIQLALEKLPPMQIGKWGQLQEWMEDWDNPEDKHRHVSHLYGLYPSGQISPYRTPELFAAAKTSLLARGDESTGWSMGWKVNLWARLQDGNHACKLITDQLTPAPTRGWGPRGGTYPNLFDAHPPFQIDGNFGCTSGIAEMLLQSYDGAIQILPALPDNWNTGRISGLKAPGGFELSFTWKNGEIEELVIKSNLGGNCRIRVPNELTFTDGTELNKALGENSNPYFSIHQVKSPIIADPGKLNLPTVHSTLLYDFSTEKGNEYVLIHKE
ncbi:MAG: glycoside hydrolase family 95 protein [Bacteroidales bacterium]|nr:glycoside hydrolase family 95 protein [Bacteroidales bacterium]